MSGSQKTLKIISIVMIVWAVIVLILGIVLAAGSAVPGMSGQDISIEGASMDMGTAALAMGIGTIIGGVINLIIGLLGMRGAKNPAKIGIFFVLCIIGLVLGVISFVMNIMSGSVSWSQVISLILVAVCTYLAFAIKKQA